MVNEFKKSLVIVCGLVLYFFPLQAQIGDDEHTTILKSEMIKSPLGEINDNDLNIMENKLHNLVLISADAKTKHLKIEIVNPVNQKIKVKICDDLNNTIVCRNCKCKDRLIIGVRKVKTNCFRVNIYNDAGVLIASQEIKKNPF